MQQQVYILQSLFLLISPFCFYSWGKLALRLLNKFQFLKDQLKIDNFNLNISRTLLLGTIFSLHTILILKIALFEWWFVSLIFLIPLYELRKSSFKVNFDPDWNLLFWLTTHLIIGMTVVYGTGDLSTSWANNYGDASFHITQISSFARAENFPPQYPIFPGERLSYPFLVNLWSAFFWWSEPTALNLSQIFLFQWVFIWTLIYFLLDGRKSKIAPWLVLFAAGNFQNIGTYSWTLIDKNFPWPTLLPTIWVPQRGAMFGAAVLITAIRLAITDKKENVCLAALIFSLGFLTNSHFMFAGLAFVVLRMIVNSALDLSWNKLRLLLPLFFGLIPGTLVFAWISNKGSALSFSPGWIFNLVTEQPKTLAQYPNFIWKSFYNFYQSIILWVQAATPWFALLFGLLLVKKNRVAVTALFFAFLFFDLVQLSYWSFDQVKPFIGLYLISIILLLESQLELRKYAYLALLLCVPAVCEFYRIAAEHPSFKLYSANDFKIANEIAQNTAKDSVIMTYPNNHTPVALSGRYIFIGYAGNIWSHGIKADKSSPRSNYANHPERLVSCDVNKELCPDYILWDDRLKQIALGAKPPENYTVSNLPYLLKRK